MSSSPYRTVSHFGFKSPVKIPRPTHFHVPLMSTNYVAITQDISVDELFSTLKYVSYPDELVPQIMRRKKLSSAIYRQYAGRRLFTRHPYAANAAEQLIHGQDMIPHRKYMKQIAKLSTAVVVSPKKRLENDEEVVVAPTTNQPEHFDRSLNTIYEENNSSLTESVEIEVDDDDVTAAAATEEVTDMQPGETFFQKLGEFDFAKESPNPEYQQPSVAAGATSTTIENETQSPLLGRQERDKRRAEFMEIWEDHLQFIATKERLSAEDEMEDHLTTASDRSSSTSAPPPAISYSTYPSDKFDEMERSVLERIDRNQLTEYDGIFLKIRQTIMDFSASRNEVSGGAAASAEEEPENGSGGFRTSTPTDLVQSSSAEEHPKADTVVTTASKRSTPNKSPAVLKVKRIAHRRRSPTMAPKQMPDRPDKRKTSQKGWAESNSTSAEHANRRKKVCRNFIAENISNASTVKRLAASSPVSGGPFLSPLSKPPKKVNGTTTTTTKSVSPILVLPFGREKTDEPKNVVPATEVTSFETVTSKRGSARFWMTINTSNTEKCEEFLEKEAIGTEIKQEPFEIDENAMEMIIDIINETINESVADTKHPDEIDLKNNTNEALETLEIGVPSENYGSNNHIDSPTSTMSSNCFSSNGTAAPSPLSSPAVIINGPVKIVDDDDYRTVKINDNISDVIDRCADHISNLRIIDLHNEMNEIMHIQEEILAEQTAQRIRFDEQRRLDWMVFNELTFSLSGDED